MGYLYLAIAIVSEVVATSALKTSEGLTRLWPSVTVVAAYVVAFYFLGLVLKFIPLGIAYGVWAGVGIVLITVVFNQIPDPAAITGMQLIVSGVVVIHFFSSSALH